MFTKTCHSHNLCPGLFLHIRVFRLSAELVTHCDRQAVGLGFLSLKTCIRRELLLVPLNLLYNIRLEIVEGLNECLPIDRSS